MNILKKTITLLLLPIITTDKLFTRFEFSSKDSILELVGENASLILHSDLNDFNGTLKLPGKTISNSVQNLDSHSINFTAGSLVLQNQPASHNLTCSIGASGPVKSKMITRKNDPPLKLQGNQTLNFNNTPIAELIEVSGKNNQITGQPSFVNKIKLLDEESELSINIQSKLSQNVILNGGKIILDDDLTMKDFVSLEGTGTVDINNYRLSMPPKSNTHSSNITFLKATDIQLTGHTALDGTWTFSGVGSSSLISGYGNVLDISSGGKIIVGDDHTLFMAGVNLKGLGVNGGEMTIENTGTVKFSTSIIEMDGNYTFTGGTIEIISPNCKLISIDGATLISSGTNSFFNVNNVLLNYECLGTSPLYPPPYKTESGGSINLLNHGSIDNPNIATLQGKFIIDVPIEQSVNYINTGLDIKRNSIIHFQNTNPQEPKTLTLNSLGRQVRADLASPGSIIVDENTTVLIENTRIHGLEMPTFDIRGTGTTLGMIIFGDGSYQSLGKSITLAGPPAIISGAAELDGNGHTLTLSTPDCIIVMGNANFTIKNITIKIDDPQAINIISDTATLTLQDMTLEITNQGLTFDSGNITCNRKVKVISNQKSSESCQINFTTKGNVLINPKSHLSLEDNIIFNYSPTATSTSETTESLRRRIQMTDNSSVLSLKNCTVITEPSGLAFDKGNLSIKKSVLFSISPTATAALELGPELKLTVNDNATLSVNGPVLYGEA